MKQRGRPEVAEGLVAEDLDHAVFLAEDWK